MIYINHKLKKNYLNQAVQYIKKYCLYYSDQNSSNIDML